MHRQPLIGGAVVVALTSSFMVGTAPSASADARSWIHPTDQFGDATGDIRAYSLSLDANRFAVSVALGAFELASAQSSTFNVELDTDGNGVANFNINKSDAAAALVYPGPAFTTIEPIACPSAALSYDSSRKSLTMSASAACIGNPTALRASYYYSVSENSDFAPAPNRFSEAVSHAVGTPTPTPTTPAPTQPAPPPTAPAPGPLPDQPGTKRLAGTDRYSTAAAIVADSFPTGPVPVVYIATGESYADALAGGPAADVQGGPVLPVAKTGIPVPILAELDRLDPARIVVLGGPGAVSDAIAAQLLTYTTGTVSRLAGTNRYDTAARVARAAFTSPVPQVLIATGTGFPDALAGGAVGAKTNSPVLLVDPNSLPAETAAALRALQPRNIAVLGGTNAVSNTLFEMLRGYTAGGVTRLAGVNRYETAARLSQTFWTTTTPVVYLATGRNFPDALAGVPAAGRDEAPLLLVEPNCMPEATSRELARLQPATTVVLGGPSTVSDAAAAGTVCAPPPPATLPAARVTLEGGFSTVEGAHYISGNLAPCVPGRLVRLYKLVGGREVHVASINNEYVECTAAGPGDAHWGTWYSFGRPGTYTFIARTVADGQSAAGASRPLTITVRTSEVNTVGNDVAFQLG